MVSETRTTIEPSDIAAIEIECRTCHTLQVRRISAWRGNVLGCTNCNQMWMTPGSGDGKALDLLVHSLSALAALNESEQKQPYKVRLEVKGIKP
jgi:hypothetical protein